MNSVEEYLRSPWARRLRAERRRRCWSQREMARRLAIVADPATRAHLPLRESLVRMIRDWEAGRHRPGDPYVELYCRVFCATEEDLFGDHIVLRREFVASLMVSLGLPLVPPHVAYLAVGRRVGPDLVGHLRRRVIRLRRVDDYLGGVDTYEMYATELKTTTTVLKEASYSEQTGRALRVVLAEQAHQAGWAAFDAGQHTEASRLFDFALKAARDTDDAALIGNSLAYRAYQKASIGLPNLNDAVASLKIAGRDAPPAVRALLLERAAWTYAAMNRTRETERALALAGEALEGARTGRTRTGPSRWTGPS